MATEIGWAGLGIIPTFDKFGTNLERGTNKAMIAAGVSGGTIFGNEAGAAAGKRFSGTLGRTIKAAGALGGLGAAFGIAGFIKDSVELEAEYGRTMAQMRVATSAPAAELQKLDDLAIKLGKDTIYSAGDAAGAMLELAKNGIAPATIQAGALKSALTLAAAGGVPLEQAATAMGNTLNAFRLRGKRAADVAAALAGAANASSASVGSLAEGLQQAGTSAKSVGFSVEETTAALAAFANAGIDGSDAGTALKTMLSRLVPSTGKAAKQMNALGIDFIKANGEFKGAAAIAQELKDGLDGLSASERSHALDVMFGSDARRAANVLMEEGAKGVKDYIKATSDSGAAERMAKANMEGTAGAIERLKGSWETAKLEFGKALAPAAVETLDYLSDNVDELGPRLEGVGNWIVKDGIPGFKKFAGFVEDAAGFTKDLAGFIDDLPKEIKIGVPAGLAALIGYGKLRGGNAGGGGGALGSLGKTLGLAKPVPVFVTNQGFGGGAGTPLAGGGKAPKGGKLGGAAKTLAMLPLPAAGALGNDTVESEKWTLEEARKAGLLYSKSLGQANDAWSKVRTSVIDGQTAAEQTEVKFRNLWGAVKDVDRLDPKVTVETPNLLAALSNAREYAGILEGIKPRVVTTFITNRLDKNEGQLERFGGARANGGTVERGKSYIVGERRPEVFVPNEPGRIEPRVGAGGPVFDFRGSTLYPHDYRDFVQQSQKRARSAAGGGVNF